MPTVHGTFRHNNTTINQYKYLDRLYQRELQIHRDCLAEYKKDVLKVLLEALANTQPNFKLYENQPYITGIVRNKLVDFLLRMAVRLKIVPYVFCKAVRLFDRYCSKRIVLLDQAQLVITTCLWIAAKFYGGNNHFANLSSSNGALVKTILNLGFGSGSRFSGPTERYRMPKTSELVKLCGTRCNYDTGMFKQMELHILTTLDWNISDATIDDYLASLIDLKSCTDAELLQELDVAAIKTFIAYSSCYSFELVKYTPLEMAKAAVDLLNTVFRLHYSDPSFFRLNASGFEDVAEIQSTEKNKYIQDLLAQAVMNSPAYLLRCFDTYGPCHLFSTLNKYYRPTFNTEILTPPRTNFPDPTKSTLSDGSQGNYTYSPCKSTSSQESYTYETVTPIVGVPYFGKCKGIRTPMTEAASVNSHHYPLLKHPTQAAKTPGALTIPIADFYPQPKAVFTDCFYQNNDSLSSVISTNSSKGSADIFYESKRFGVCTPVSMEDDIKPTTRRKKSA